MAVFPISDEFPRGLQFLIDNVFNRTQLLFVERTSGWIDAYYTLLGPLVIVALMAISNKFTLRGGIIGTSFLIPVWYFIFSQFLQHTTITEYLFDKNTQEFSIQKVVLDHDKTTPREVIRAIPFKHIAAIQYLSCPLEYPFIGHELNLILTSGQRLNLFNTTDPTMTINADAIQNIIDIPLLTPECQLH